MKKWQRYQYLPGTPPGKDGRRATASAEHIALSCEAAQEGMVLLKNDENVLPLAYGSRIALFGKGTFDYVKGGGGSGDVTVSYIRNLYEGFKELGDKTAVYEELCDYYRAYVDAEYASGKVPGMITEPELPEELLKGARAYTDTAIISISRFSGEGWDRKSSFDGNKLKNGNGTSKIKAFRGYIKYTAVSPAAKDYTPEINFFIEDEEGNTTAINHIEGLKVITDGAVYNMSGQRVSNSTKGLKKGLYIVNGKKYFVK